MFIFVVKVCLKSPEDMELKVWKEDENVVLKLQMIDILFYQMTRIFKLDSMGNINIQLCNNRYNIV